MILLFIDFRLPRIHGIRKQFRPSRRNSRQTSMPDKSISHLLFIKKLFRLASSIPRFRFLSSLSFPKVLLHCRRISDTVDGARGSGGDVARRLGDVVSQPDWSHKENVLRRTRFRCPKLDVGLFEWLRDECGFHHSRFSRLLASHAYAHTRKFEALNCNLQQLLEDEGVGSAEALCQLLSSGFSDWGSHGLVWDALTFAYLRLGMLHDALFVLGEMKDLGLRVSTPTYNSLLHNLRKTDIMWDAYHGMKMHDDRPSECTYSIIVDGFCEQHRLLDAITFMWDIDLEFGPSVTSYNTLISRFCKMGFVDVAQSYLCKLMKCGLEPDTYSYNIIINGCCIAGSMEDALKYASDMDNQGLGPDEVTYNILTKGLHLLRPTDGAFNVIGTMLPTEDMVSQNICLGEISHAAFLSSLCSSGKLTEALQLVGEMEANNLIPDMLMYSILIRSLCKAGEVERAIVLYRKLVSKRMFPDSFAHSALLMGLCGKESSTEARVLFDSLVNGGFTNNVIWYNIMIDHYAKVGNIDEAIRIFRQLIAKGISPSIATFNSLISGLCKHRKTSDAWQWIETIKLYGLRPTTRTYTIVMNVHFEEGNIDKMLELLHQMEENDVMPNHVTYTVVMKGLCKKKRLEEAIGLLKVMRSSGLRPDERTYNTLIQYLCQAAHIEVALKLYDEMLEYNLEPSTVTYNLLMNGLCRLSDLTGADSFFIFLLEKNISLSKVAYTTLIKAHCAKGSVRRSREIFRQMIKQGYTTSIRDYSAVINRLCKRYLIEGVKQFFLMMLYDGVLPDEDICKQMLTAFHQSGNFRSILELVAWMIKFGLSRIISQS